MRKVFLVLTIVMMAGSAMAAVTIKASQVAGEPMQFSLDYAATGADSDVTDTYSLISGMAINVSLGNGDAGSFPTMDIVAGSFKTTGESVNGDAGYGIYPGSIQFDVNSNMTDSGDPIAPAADAGALGDLPGNACTIEVGALFDKDASPTAEPLASGIICKFQVMLGGNCNYSSTVSLSVEDVHRKGVVMRDGSSPSVLTLVGTQVGGLCVETCPFLCWTSTQCHGDTDQDGDVDGSDFLVFKASWATNRDDADYNCCADFDRDGDVDGMDFLEFKNNWAQTVWDDCW